MSLLDTASLLLTPNAYKEGKLYSVIPSDGSGDLSVTRATTATRVNSAGLVELVPYNLLTYSEQFNNAAWNWVANSTTTANATTAPNGTLTADLLTESATLGKHYKGTSFSLYIPNSVTTTSVYVKPNGRTKFSITFDNDSQLNAGFDLLNESTIYTQTNVISASVENVGNGWYRCLVTNTPTRANPYVTFNILDNSGNASYTGDGTSGVYLWGAQAVEGTEAKDYYPTETRLNIPRLDYSLGSCPSILVEPQRTNLVTYSEQFNDVSWTKNLGGVGGVPVVTSNAGISPSGITNADRIQFTLNGGTTTADISDIRKLITTTAGTYTFSFWVKSFDGVSSYQMLVRDPNGITNQMVVTGEWQRYTITAATYPTGNASMGFGIRGGQTPINSGTADILVWGAQLEAGAYATSYIPTTSASVTRNGDLITRNVTQDFSGDWTIFLDSMRLADNNEFQTNNGYLYYYGGTNYIQLVNGTNGTLRLRIGGSTNVYTPNNSVTKGVRFKWLAKKEGSEIKLFLNGALYGTSTTLANGFTNFQIGILTAFPINSLVEFTTAITDAQCITLTTI